MGSSAVVIDGIIAVKRMDEGAGEAFMRTRLNMISWEISPERTGKFRKKL